MSWIEIADLVMASGLIAVVSYRIGYRRGTAQADQQERLASMRRHPSNHLRSVD